MTTPARESHNKRPARVASSTAKLDAMIAHSERIESSIDRLAESVHQLALSSVRFEERSSSQELRIIELEKSTGSLKETVARLEENRLTQQYWLRKIGGAVMVPVMIGALIVAGAIYVGAFA